MTRFGYDPNCGCSGRQAFITNALGQVTLRSYDANANESSITDALGRTTTFLYDELDRRTYTIFADGSWNLTSYDAIGRRIAETDQSTNTTWFGYDGLGRLTAVTNALGQGWPSVRWAECQQCRRKTKRPRQAGEEDFGDLQSGWSYAQ